MKVERTRGGRETDQEEKVWKRLVEEGNKGGLIIIRVRVDT